MIGIVHNEVSHNLHLLDVHITMQNKSVKDVVKTIADNPVQLSEYLVKSYIDFLMDT